MQAVRRGVLAWAVILVVWCTSARADSIKHPAGFTFHLPDIGKNWEQEIKGDLVIASDETDTLPELTVFVFPPTQEGTLAQIQGRLEAELARRGVALVGAPIKSVKDVAGKPETIADATAIRGTATVNTERAAFAIVQRGGKSLILLAVPSAGTFPRGSVNFREIVRGLQPGAAPRALPAADVTAIVTEMMPEIALVERVTATSTFVDKKQKQRKKPNPYAPENVIAYDVVDDRLAGPVPKTAWCEGKPDEGIGEAITIAFARPEHIDGLEIAAGVWLSDKYFKANNRIVALDVSVDGGKATRVTPSADREWASVKIGRPVTTIAIAIAAVERGTMNDSCISGVRLHRKPGLELMWRDTLAPDALAALPKNLATIQAALLDPGYAALRDVFEFPFAFDAGGGATRYASWKALEAACKKQRGDGPLAKCPSGRFFEVPYAGKLGVDAPRAGELVVTFPPLGGSINHWRLKWRAGAWRLTTVENVDQLRD